MAFSGFGSWAVALNGVILTSCGDGQTLWDQSDCADGSTVLDALTDTPDGLGLPGLRTEDIQFLQRDGVKHFADWYEPRLVTLQASIGPDCEDCVAVREQMFTISQAWGRTCCDTEMVLYPPCEPADTQEGRTFTGPYGVIGRPRIAEHKWDYRGDNVATFLLRFDGVDQRMYVLDECGTPGYSRCVELEPSSEVSCMAFVGGELCFGPSGELCFDTPVGDVVDPTTIDVFGTERSFPVIVFSPDLNQPRIENVTTGEALQYNGVVFGSPVTVNTEDGTAFQDGTSVTHLLSGSLLMSLDPGTYDIQLVSRGASDTGTASFCWRDTVKVA